MPLTRRLAAFCLAFTAAASAASAADAPAKPVVLFDGTSLHGWHQAGPGKFELHDGMITATGGMGLLWNDRPLANFTAHVEYKVEKPSDNSGVFVRFPDPGNDPWVAVNQGHEIQICDTEPHNHTGAIYNFKDSTSVPNNPVGQWNDLDITVVDRHYTVSLNGKPINDYTSTRGVRGFLGLQNHWDAVSFRKVVVTELPGPSAADTVAPPVALVDPTPGLVGRYFDNIHKFDDIGTPGRKPFFVHVDPRINFPLANGDFNGSHLLEWFGVRWTGSVHIDKPGTYTFDTASDDGSKLTVNGTVVVDNTGMHEMQDRAGTVILPAAGDYPVVLDFQQGINDAGCVLKWQPPGTDKLAVVPAKALLHAKADGDVAWDHTAWDQLGAHHREFTKAHGKKWERMDYGPFLSGTFDAPEPKGNTALKGIIVSFDKDQTTNVLFDTETLRYAAGWTGDFINFNGVAYDGQHVATPKIAGTQVFGTPVMPGWADKGGSFKDPRVPAADNTHGQPAVPVGNLPWCHYRGLYRCGDQVVFSYTVNGVGVLDTPSTGVPTPQPANEVPLPNMAGFVRHLQVDPATFPLQLLVKDSADKSVDVEATGGATISDDGQGHTVATIPPHGVPTQYGIVVTKSPAGVGGLYQWKIDVDFTALTHGGPRRWGDPIVTQGHLGDGAGPYVVDTITLPEKTPFNAWMRTSGFDFFPDGHSAAVCTWNGDVWIVKGIDDKLDHLTWQRYATGLFQTLGLKIVNGEVYVLGRDQITRLHDLNGDGEADWYENFNNDCVVGHGFHEFQHDLQVDSHGNFYYAKGGSVNGGGNGFQYTTPDNGCILKVTPDGQHLSIVATGLRAPNGTSMGPQDQMTVSDNQGTWTPACRISFVTPGAFLGVPSTSHLTPPPTNYGNPICWFPYVDGDYTTGDNSSGGAAWDTTDKWGPLNGHMIHLSYGTCSIFNTSIEQVDGVWQGGVIRMPLDFDSGTMRARFNPVDGQLYVCGLKGWQTRAAKDGAFQRVRYTGKPARMPVDIHVRHDGLAITFSDALDPSSATDPDNYSTEEWNYIWSGAYGSPDVSRDNPKKHGHDTVDVDTITLSPDGKTVFLKMNDLRPVMQMKTILKVKCADGTPMVTWEIDNTVNKVPGVPGSIATTQPGTVTLPPTQRSN
jgi:hypothetical protein